MLSIREISASLRFDPMLMPRWPLLYVHPRGSIRDAGDDQSVVVNHIKSRGGYPSMGPRG
jgi:hypothetical protein